MIDSNFQKNIIINETSDLKKGKALMQKALKSCEFSQIDLTNKLIENLSNFSMLKKSSQAVLLRLTRYYNAKKEAMGQSSIYPSEQTLSINCNVSERTVKRAIKELKDNNLILVIKSNKRYSVNHYKLTNNFFELLQMSPTKGQNVPFIGDKMSPKQRNLTNKIKKIYIKNFKNLKNPVRFKEITKVFKIDIKSMSDNIYYVKTEVNNTFEQNISDDNFKRQENDLNYISKGYTEDITNQGIKYIKQAEKVSFQEKKSFIWKFLSENEKLNYSKLPSKKENYQELDKLTFVVNKYAQIQANILKQRKQDDFRNENIKNAEISKRETLTAEQRWEGLKQIENEKVRLMLMRSFNRENKTDYEVI